MVHYRRDTKVRWPVLKQVYVTATITDALTFFGPFSEYRSQEVAESLRCSGGTQHAPGHSAIDDFGDLLACFWKTAMEHELAVYVDRFPTDSNVSDGPSRSRFQVL